MYSRVVLRNIVQLKKYYTVHGNSILTENNDDGQQRQHTLNLSLLPEMVCLSKFLSEHFENLSESYVGRIPPPKRLTNMSSNSSLFHCHKHAHHGTDSAALLTPRTHAE